MPQKIETKVFLDREKEFVAKNCCGSEIKKRREIGVALKTFIALKAEIGPSLVSSSKQV